MARRFWTGNGRPGDLRDPRNWGTRRRSLGGASAPRPGDEVVVDGRRLAEELWLPRAVFRLVLRRCAVREMSGDGIVVGAPPGRSRRLPRLSWASVRRALHPGGLFRSQSAWSIRRTRLYRLLFPARVGVWRLEREARRRAFLFRYRLGLTVTLARVRWQVGRAHAAAPLRDRSKLDRARAVLEGAARFDRGRLVPVLAGGSTIVASVAGGNWSAAGTWIGGVPPSATDDAVLASTSGSVTVDAGAACQNLDCTGYTATLTFTSTLTTTPTTQVKFASTMTIAGAGTLNVNPGAAVTATLTFGTKTIPNLTISGSTTGTVTFGDASTVSATVTLTTGTLDTNAKSCTWGAFSSNNSNIRTLTPHGSAISITNAAGSFNTSTAVNMEVSSNAATVTFTNGGDLSTLGCPPSGWGGISFVLQANTGLTNNLFVDRSNQVGIANFTITGSANKNLAYSLRGNLVCTGTFAANGNSTVNRVFIQTSLVGLPYVISAGSVSTSNLDLMDIVGTGAGSWDLSAIAGNSGDAGGNAGITFTTPATQTATATTNWSWSDATKWTSRVPLPQDDVTVSITAGTPAITPDMPRLGKSINFSGTTVAATCNLNVGGTNYLFFGSMTVPAVMTFSGNNRTDAAGRGSFTLNIAKQLSIALKINAPGGTYTLAADLLANGNANAFAVITGTFDASTFNVQCSTFTFTGSQPRTVRLGSATWTVRGTGTAWSASGSNLTLTAGTALIDFTSTSGAVTFAGGSLAYAGLRSNVTGANGFTITGSNTFSTLDVRCSTARTFALPASGRQIVTTSVTLQGAAGQLLSLVSSTPGTRTAIFLQGATLTNTSTSVSADVVVQNSVSNTAALPAEGTEAKQAPRSFSIPLASALANRAPVLANLGGGSVVVCVEMDFNSADGSAATFQQMVSLDAGAAGNQFRLGWIGGGNTLTAGVGWSFQRTDPVNGVSPQDAEPQIADSFVSGDRRVVAGSWDATSSYVSVAGSAFQSYRSARTPTSIDFVRFFTTVAGGATFVGSPIWIAMFASKISDADVAALNAAYLNSYPGWGDLPGTPTLLYRADWGYFVTAEGSTGYLDAEAAGGVLAQGLDPAEALDGLTAALAEPIEALRAGIAASALDPVEALRAVAGSGRLELEALAAVLFAAGLPVEAILDVVGAAEAPFEALLDGVVAALSVPLEALRGTDPRLVAMAIEALGAILSAPRLPVEAKALASARAAEPFEALPPGVARAFLLPWEANRGVAAREQAEIEALRGVLHALLLPFEARARLRDGKVVSTVARRSAVEGQTARTSSIVHGMEAPE